MVMVEKVRDEAGSWRDAKQYATQGRGRIKLLARFIPAGIAAVLLVAALVLPAFMFNTDRRPGVSGPGPDAWPNLVLTLLAICAAIWLISELWLLVRRKASTGLAAPHDEDSYHYGKALVGIGLVLAFGWLLPVIGFPLACTGFLLIWCIYGGLRHPAVLLLVPTIGTAALLWMFMGLALMPLSRGSGAFDRFSVAVLQLLGIY